MQAVIMAGGKGTRFQTITKDIPKPMYPILGKPILEYQIENLRQNGITDIIIVTGYLGEVIHDHFGDGRKYGVSISYIHEKKPLGTAGSLYYLKGKMTDDFAMIFGDLIFEIDWQRFRHFHKSHKGLVTLYCHPNTHPYDSDVIENDSNDIVTRINPKSEERHFYYHNLVNAGLYCVSPQLLDFITGPEKIDFEKNIIAEQIDQHKVYAYRSSEYVKDMGTPDRLKDVTNDLKKGIVSKRNLKNKQRAVFLDRDGTINVFKGFLTKAEDFELLPGVSNAIKLLNQSEFLTIVATNQPVIARGECSFEELNRIHCKMETDLAENGAYLDDIYFCPHHPDKGFEGEVPELKIDCECRKPKIGMLRQASERYNIDLHASWYVGDTTRDVQTGINAGMRTILVKTGENGQDHRYDVRPTYEASELIDAVNIILGDV